MTSALIKASPWQLQVRGTLLVALSGLLYSLIGFLGTRLVDGHFSVENMLFWRFFTAAIWMSFSIIIFQKNILHLLKNQPSLFKVSLFGTLTYSAGSLFYFVATRYVGTGIAMVIFFSFPVFVALFAWLFTGWQINKYSFLSLLAVVVGLFFLKGQGDHTLNLTGILLAAIASFFYAVYVYGSRHTAKIVDSRLLTFFVCSGCSIIFLCLSCYTGHFIFPHTFSAWLYICAIGVLATAVPIQLLLDGLKYISPIRASILSVLEPVGTVVIGIFVLHEMVTVTQTIGIVIVLLGAIFIQFERQAE